MTIKNAFFITLTAMIMATSFSALADSTTEGPAYFAGTWKGKGTYILREDMTQCSNFELTFSGDASSFVFVQGKRDCDKHSEVFYQVKMDAKDGLLYFNGKNVGTYNGKILTAAFQMPEGNGHVRNWRMSMHREGTHLMYEESRTMDSDVTPLISFAGLLIITN